MTCVLKFVKMFDNSFYPETIFSPMTLFAIFLFYNKQ